MTYSLLFRLNITEYLLWMPLPSTAELMQSVTCIVFIYTCLYITLCTILYSCFLKFIDSLVARLANRDCLKILTIVGIFFFFHYSYIAFLLFYH